MRKLLVLTSLMGVMGSVQLHCMQPMPVTGIRPSLSEGAYFKDKQLYMDLTKDQVCAEFKDAQAYTDARVVRSAEDINASCELVGAICQKTGALLGTAVTSVSQYGTDISSLGRTLLDYLRRIFCRKQIAVELNVNPFIEN